VAGPTMIFEVVALQDLWIWGSFFGLPSSFNDTIALKRSPFFQMLALGVAPKVEFEVNVH
jgi:hypothetical protein